MDIQSILVSLCHSHRSLTRLDLVNTHFIPAFGLHVCLWRSRVLRTRHLSGVVVFLQTQTVMSNMPGPYRELSERLPLCPLYWFFVSGQAIGGGWLAESLPFNKDLGFVVEVGSLWAQEGRVRSAIFSGCRNKYSACSSKPASLERWGDWWWPPAWLAITYKAESNFKSLLAILLSL